MRIQGLKGANMNWKNRLTNYNFWISIFSAILLVLQALKIELDIAYVNEIFTAVLGLLVVIGIINDPTRTSVKITAKETDITKENITEQNVETQQKDNTVTENVSNEESSIKEEVNEENKETQASLPIDEENEINGELNENVEQVVLVQDEQTNLKALIDKISSDLDSKIKQLEIYNKEMAQKNEQINSELESKLLQVEDDLKEIDIEPVVNEAVDNTNEQPTPAAAETDCSYLNIIN